LNVSRTREAFLRFGLKKETGKQARDADLCDDANLFVSPKCANENNGTCASANSLT
jgi:hypothetical protein